MEWVIFLGVGVIVGLLAGLFGLGGGVIMVPVLLFIFSKQQVSPDYVMHVAVGMSLAIMIITTISSVLSHQRHGSLMMNLFWRFFPGLVVGTVMGAMVSHTLKTDVLRMIFATFLLVVGLRMFYEGFIKKRGLETGIEHIPSQTNISLVSVIVGLLAGMLGIGAGSITIPYFTFYKINMRHAAGTASAFSLVIATVGTVIMMIDGWSRVHLPASTGYVYWPAFGGIALSSLVFAPVGSWLAHHLRQRVLKRIFTVILFALSFNMFFGA